MARVGGIHHVTAITGDLERNLAWYAGALGMRLVKRTVNFDDPASWHLYFGDELGRPGSIMTFFVWPGGWRGRRGTGQVGAIAFAVPPAALAFWSARLGSLGVACTTGRRFGAEVLGFRDPDGIALELVAHEPASALPGWSGGPVPAEAAIRGFHSVTLHHAEDAGTAAMLTGTLGFSEAGSEGERVRFRAGDAGVGAFVDLLPVVGLPRGGDGVGAVHHVAFRAADDAAELALRSAVAARGLHATPQVDRAYFRSVYFREPGGVLFEVATDEPGFTVDEPADALGQRLMLPPQYERRRGEIERALPPFPEIEAIVAGGVRAVRS